MGRIRRPETVRLLISGDDWLLVKKHLTAGESRRVYGRMVKRLIPGQPIELDPVEVGRTLASEYLLDWNLTGADEQVIAIRGKGASEIADVLDQLDPETFAEITQAIETHDEAMRRLRDEEKKTRTTLIGSGAIS